VAIGVEDRRTDATVVVILVECADDADRPALVHAVRSEVAARIGLALHAVVPLRRGEMVKTTSGKISRVKNRELYLAGRLPSGGA
jgi:acyl-coenzyme A synthetase/AMP-(fatty) acid ligase